MAQLKVIIIKEKAPKYSELLFLNNISPLGDGG